MGVEWGHGGVGGGNGYRAHICVTGIWSSPQTSVQCLTFCFAVHLKRGPNVALSSLQSAAIECFLARLIGLRAYTPHWVGFEWGGGVCCARQKGGLSAGSVGDPLALFASLRRCSLGVCGGDNPLAPLGLIVMCAGPSDQLPPCDTSVPCVTQTSGQFRPPPARFTPGERPSPPHPRSKEGAQVVGV